MSAEERDNKIISALKEGIILTFTEIRKKTGLTDSALDRGLKFLMKTGKVVHEERLYALFENKDKLKDIIKSQSNKKIESPLAYQICREHMDDLREILKVWKTELSVKKILSGEESPSPGDTSTILSFPRLVPAVVDRDFEKNWRFQHLRVHLPELMKKWDDFKLMLRQQYEMGNDLIFKLGKRIAHDLGMDFVYREEMPGVQVGYPTVLLRSLSDLARDGKKLSKGKGKHLYETFQYREGIITGTPLHPISRIIKNNPIIRIPNRPGEDEKIFPDAGFLDAGTIYYPVPIYSSNCYSTHVVQNWPRKSEDAYYVVEATCKVNESRYSASDQKFYTCIKLPKGIEYESDKYGELLEKLKRYKGDLDGCRKSLMGELKDPNSEYMKEVMKFSELCDKLWTLRDDLERDIDKYSGYSFLPNICDIIEEELNVMGL